MSAQPDPWPPSVVTPAPAATLDGALIGKEIFLVDTEEWVKVIRVTHERDRTVVLNGDRARYIFQPDTIVRYRNKQT